MVNDLVNKIITKKFDNDCEAGTEVLNALSSLSDLDMQTIADAIVLIYPSVNDIQRDPSRSHTPQALFIRNIFGVLKNGCLLDQSNPDRISNIQHNYDKVNSWDNSFKFAHFLEQSFQKINNTYGLLILYEMLGHRYGDLAVTGNDKDKNISLMKENYVKSYNAAVSIGCEKQYFTPWYWGACYFSKLQLHHDAVEWHTRFYSEAESHMRGRSSYKDKLKRSINMLKSSMTYDDFKKLVGKWSKSKNEMMRKVFREFNAN